LRTLYVWEIALMSPQWLRPSHGRRSERHVVRNLNGDDFYEDLHAKSSRKQENNKQVAMATKLPCLEKSLEHRYEQEFGHKTTIPRFLRV
jgi:hypothetical protein